MSGRDLERGRASERVRSVYGERHRQLHAVVRARAPVPAFEWRLWSWSWSWMMPVPVMAMTRLPACAPSLFRARSPPASAMPMTDRPSTGVHVSVCVCRVSLGRRRA